MPSAADTHGENPSADAEMDDLFGYDANIDHIFRDASTDINAPPDKSMEKAMTSAIDIGIDKEVDIVKPRRPIAKLDENR